MKTQLKIAAIGLLGLALSGLRAHAQGSTILHNLSTGVVNGSTTLISYGATDDTWTVASPGNSFQPAFVCSSVNGWSTNGCGRWITPKLDGTYPAVITTGVYQYQTKFTLNYLCFPWVKINLAYLGGDNNVVGCSVNGYSYTLAPATANDYNILAQNVTINVNPAHLVLGVNTIVIQVDNSGAGTGFFACGAVTAGICSRIAGGQVTSNSLLGTGDDVQVYPNPSTGRFTVAIDASIEGDIELTDITGRSVQRISLHKGASVYPVDLSAQPKGIYILSARTPTGTILRKIALQ